MTALPTQERERPSAHAETPVLRVDRVSKQFNGTVALRECSLTVNPGEVLGLIGANGAGKSTMVKIISGAIQPDSGTVSIGDWSGDSLTPRTAHALGVSTIYQELDLVPTLSAVENLVLGSEPRRGGLFLSRGSERRLAEESLSRVGFEARRMRRTVAELSRAEQQLVEIARALHRRSRVILMDEPTAPLGPRETDALLSLMGDLIRDSDVAIVYVSHRLDELLLASDRVQVMRDGRSVWTRDAADLDKGQIVEAMVGHLVTTVKSGGDRVAGETVLRVEDLSCSPWLHDVSLEVRAGEVLGIGGLVGSGRSRLLRILAGAERADGGTIMLGGKRYAPHSPADAIRQGVGLVPSDRKGEGLLRAMDIEANLTAVRPASFATVLRRRSNLATARHWIEELGIVPARPKVEVSTLSGGNQQKVLVGRWLNADVDLLLVDEPGEGVDVKGKAEIYGIIRRGARDGKAVIVASSETEELFEVADRIGVMRGGRLVGYLPKSASERELLQLATGTASGHTINGGGKK